jgi:DNA-binding GntR family transcriptional regulator
LWDQLNPFARTYMTSVSRGFDPNSIFERHNVIIEALAAGDPEHAAETMRNHIREAEEMLVKGIE